MALRIDLTKNVHIEKTETPGEGTNTMFRYEVVSGKIDIELELKRTEGSL